LAAAAIIATSRYLTAGVEPGPASGAGSCQFVRTQAMARSMSSGRRVPIHAQVSSSP
jgi:hypothetical protein